MWQAGTDIETPAEYKKRYRTAQAEKPEMEEDPEPEPEPKGKSIFDRIFRRGKLGKGNHSVP